jgi:2-polyprenyl-3-methyl-5-hydroxy-6-metoxy-1,4-benzoquinol methylase
VELANKVAKEIKKTISVKSKKILEVGCATGLISFQFSQEAKKVIGIDTSRKMVEEFNKKSSKNIYAISVPLEKLKENEFDIVVASMTLHHIKNLTNFFKDVHKKLKKGGFFCIADLYKEDGSFHDKGNDGVFHFGFYPQELKKEIVKFNFNLLYSKILYTIKKAREFPVFFQCYQKR